MIALGPRAIGRAGLVAVLAIGLIHITQQVIAGLVAWHMGALP